MFKFTERGLEEFGGINELTKDDLLTISEDIAVKSSLPNLQRVNGVWVQRTPMEMMEIGYRIHEEDDYDPIAEIGKTIEKAKTWQQLHQVVALA